VEGGESPSEEKMNSEYIPFVLWGSALAGILVCVGYFAYRRHKWKSLPYGFRPRSCGPATIGAFYDLLNEEQRHTMEIIVEQRAEERRPEYPDCIPPAPKPECEPK
jgi:hypothetical protein